MHRAGPGTWMKVGILLVLLLVAAGPRPATAAEMWTPQAGEVSLEETPRDEPEAKFRHACGLVAADQPESALPILNELIAKHPDAEFAEKARYVRGLALFRAGEYWDAFERLEAFVRALPESSWVREARELQMKAALTVGRDDMEEGCELLDRLIEGSATDASAARYRKEKADLIFRHKRYLRAKDQYLAVVDYHPHSRWVPYCYLRVGQCELQQSMWLRRGVQHVERARKTLTHLLEAYGDQGPREEAEEALERARRLEAGQNRRIARFYIEDKDRPEAALTYLRRIVDEFPETKHAQWAAKKLDEVRGSLPSPPQGQFRKVPLPGSESGGGESAG